MLDQQKNILIGIFVIVAIAIFSYILLFLHPSVGDEGQTLRVRFANIDKVNVGTRVLFGGRPVGEVVSIQEVQNARDPSLLRDDKVYIYELVLKIDSSIEVYETDEVSIQTSGLLGEKSIEITPRPAEKGQKLVRIKGQVMYSEPQGSIEEAVIQFTALAKVARETIQKVSNQIDVLVGEEFFEHLGDIARNTSEITQDISEGKGTLGRFIGSDDLYLRLVSIMNKGETVMDDINHYGLLFHNNKGWQRLRARRANLMAKLETPQEFRNFFNDEVDQITTALARVNMVVNESESDLCMPVVCRPEFQKVFADLLRRVEGLEENLKLYDQQIVDTLENKCENYGTCR